MKLNPDCIRDVLLVAENCPMNKQLSFDNLYNELSNKYERNEVRYTCLKLKEANFLNIVTSSKSSDHFPSVVKITDITYMGHEFLNNIRKDSVWERVKTIAAKIGCGSLSALSQIAANVLTELIKAQFPLT